MGVRVWAGVRCCVCALRLGQLGCSLVVNWCSNGCGCYCVAVSLQWWNWVAAWCGCEVVKEGNVGSCSEGVYATEMECVCVCVCCEFAVRRGGCVSERV